MIERQLLVVGAGPAGLATAIAARLAGFEVHVLERRRPPLDKPCGEGLMPDAVEGLVALGVRIESARPFRGIRYIDGETVADGDFPRGVGLGVRRLELHRALVERCRELGVQISWGERVVGLRLDVGGGEVETAERTHAARWIVAADGLASPLRRMAGLEGKSSPQRRFGVRRHYRLAPWSDRAEVHWGPSCEAYVTPVAEDEVGVAMLWGGGGGGFDHLLASFPRLAERLAGATPTSRDLGCGPLRQRVRKVYRGPLALVGDAAGYVDAITGEGVALAMHQAPALVRALTAGDLELYARAHRKIARLPDTVTAAVLVLARRPWLRRRTIRTLAADPALFDRILGIHTRTHRLQELGLSGLWRLARGLAVS